MTIHDLDTAPCGYLVFTDDGIISDVNKTLTAMLDYGDRSMVSGRHIESLFTTAGRIFYQTHFFPLLRLHGRADEIFFTLVGKDKKELPVICNGVRKGEGDKAENHCIVIPALQRSKYEQELLYARREAEQVLLQNRELKTAKEQLEKQAIDLDRRLSEVEHMNADLIQFGKVVSHDLQEPIRKIAVFADRIALEQESTIGLWATEQLRKINRECVRLRHLAMNLDRFISLNLSMAPVALVDLNECIKIALTLARETIPDREVLLSVESLPQIEGFEKQLELLFYHLFKNCLQFSPSGRAVEIGVSYTSFRQNSYRHIKERYRYVDFIRVTVSDNGVGFDSSERRELFKISRNRSGDLAALSFGLAFCKKIVDNHYGIISVESTVGCGTLVHLTLPMRHD